MTKTEALSMALEALENTTPTGFNMERDKQFFAAITAIKEALAQPEQDSDYKAIGKQAYESGYSTGYMDCAVKMKAHPEQEPVGEVEQIDIDDEGTASAWFTIATEILNLGDKLYTTPPQHSTIARKPLTDEQKLMCWSRATHDADIEHKTEHQCLMDYGSEIEAAHGIKGDA